eukprot:CAMPEP_0194550104 /NCGR_PEP_ID=MMETSP0253-20130528/95540_1 /TAXON_ID=2966 /ORGANISM="Noctiluca scintillans" /LENGTH=1755 /DNA_ID=CAMNT_0039397539 /DNA_START=38 /DNA_END=5304 /DNA_ORIENTATION=-
MELCIPWKAILLVGWLTSILCDASTTTSESTPPELIEQEELSATVADTTHEWSVDRKHQCHGSEVERSACPDLPPCNSCTPQDCVLGSWGDWSADHGCSGLKERHRDVATRNNECGKPCSAVLVETAVTSLCKHTVQDCTWEDWGDWSECPWGEQQASRARSIQQLLEGGGKPCEGESEQTRPCDQKERAVDCKLSDWNDWSICSESCDEGRRTRVRRIVVPAAHEGEPCSDSIMEVDVCNVKPCGKKVSCQVGDWSDWYGCTKDGPRSVFKARKRKLVSPAAQGGKACTEVLEETLGCANLTQPCQLGSWSDWSDCPKSCGGAQQFRKRKELALPTGGGDCPSSSLQETRPCSEDPCAPAEEDCQLGPWGTWGQCSAACGVGQQARNRTVTKETSPGGIGCVAAISETQSCSVTDCAPVDCKWDHWAQWSGCTCSCDGGTRMRNRHILKSPTHGGKYCDARLKTEVAPCNTQPCYDMNQTDGKWTTWSKWSECTATCGGGVQTKHRSVAQTASPSGKALSGSMEEFKSCATNSCNVDADCELSEWAEWSDCSCTCFGHRERSRMVSSFARGKGKACHESLREVAPCNPGLKGDNTLAEASAGCESAYPAPCEYNKWEDWTSCTVSCAGGQRTRARGISNSPCAGSDQALMDIIACNTQSCSQDCQDCQWTDWSDWSACTKCGGQKTRNRQIATYGNECGSPCAPGADQEVGVCPIHCDVFYCSWSDWSESTGCTATCGAATFARDRHLRLIDSETTEMEPADYMFKGDARTTCRGIQNDIQACENKACMENCTSIDCKLSDWSDWTQELCNGLCSRSRTRLRENNACGRPCDGTLTDTKVCGSPACHSPVDCEFTQWSGWSPCTSKSSQRTRFREVLREALNGGTPCAGFTKETDACSGRHVVTDCLFSDWQDWSECSVSCDGGSSERSRYIAQAAEGGLSGTCFGSLTDLKGCATKPCSKNDAEVSDWSDWTECSENNQTLRSRFIQREAQGGEPFEGILNETKSCQRQESDCHMAKWSTWDSCDRSCGGGQQQRHRLIMQLPSRPLAVCPANIVETRPCNSEMCNPHKDCLMKEWSAWRSCSVSCGFGQQSRSRHPARLAQKGGEGCTDSVREVKGCFEKDCVKSVDCKWNSWHEWSACSCSCGGGTKTRTRHIKTYPQGDGELCDALHRVEMVPCNSQSCEKCIDGKWGSWAEWADCSASCEGGVTWRHRHVVRQANHCGEPPYGLQQDYKQCNSGTSCSKDKDCRWGEWHDWNGCTAACDGVTRRSRDISIHGSGKGKFCDGPQEEVVPCNPGKGEKPPEECQKGVPVDCKSPIGNLGDPVQFLVARDSANEKCIDGKWGSWAEWADCSASCEGGVTWRHRHVVRQANHCGEPPYGLQQDYKQCNAEVSCSKDKDCHWGAWNDWNGCTAACDGTQRRSRQVSLPGAGKGKFCDGPQEEVVPCNPGKGEKTPEQCQKGVPVDCKLAHWESWGSCSVSCGKGQRQRSRTFTPAAFGGAPCDAATEELGVCSEKQCRTDKKDCEWNEWHHWGSCTKCSGQKFRTRTVKSYNTNGGKPCEPGAAREVARCDQRICGTQLYCGWGEWQEWGSCSSACGMGERERRRSLAVSYEKPDSSRLEEENAELEMQLQDGNSFNAQHLLLAFSAGAFSLVLMMGVVHVWRKVALRAVPGGEYATLGSSNLSNWKHWDDACVSGLIFPTAQRDFQVSVHGADRSHEAKEPGSWCAIVLGLPCDCPLGLTMPFNLHHARVSNH